jgi:hypothetical protein
MHGVMLAPVASTEIGASAVFPYVSAPVEYSFQVASALAHLVSRSAVSMVRAFSKILTLSSRVASASSLRVISSSYARSSFYNSAATAASGVAVVGLGGGEGRGLHKANAEKSRTHQ